MLPYYGDVSLMQARCVACCRNRTVIGDSPLSMTAKNPVYRNGLLSLGDSSFRYERNEANLGVTGNYLKCLLAGRGGVLGHDGLG